MQVMEAFMYATGDVSFRTRFSSAALILCALSVACEPEPSAPDGTAIFPQPPVLRVARARIIEPGDLRIPNPPGVDAWSTANVADRVNMAFDANAKRLFIFESSTNQLIEGLTGPDAGVSRQTLNRIDAQSFGLRDPQGLTVDPASGRVFVLDAGSRIVRIEPHSLRGFSGAIVSTLDLAPAGLSRLRGIAFDPTGGNLHVLDPVAQALHEISQTGRIVGTWDVSEFRLHDPQGMTFGPTGDATDDESAMGLYIASGGRITELSLVALAAAPAPSGTAALVRTTATSGFAKPSPDPSGIAYASHRANLVIADGEVDEMSIYDGANVFETTLSGSLSRTWTTTSFSKEPTGTGYNPANRHLFISDDDGTQIYEVDPGPDGLYGTADDRRTSFDTAVFGCKDPEGVAFDATNGVLFIADGTNAQVYRVSPGSNRVFDGVSPSGDDQVTNFDTQVHGLLDPEGIAYDSDFGHLYVVGKPENLVFHLTTTGALIRAIDISPAQPDKPAGLEYAPGSANSSTKMLYLVDRGVDNNDNPNENDGKLYEFSLPLFSGNVLPTATITAPPNGSAFIQGDVITFTGTASDAEDGNLTAGLSWTSSLDGALGSGGSVSTGSLSVGTHTITASVTDSDGGQGSDAVTVTVNPPGLVQARVATGADDAEESDVGKVSLTSSDLELVFDKVNQTVGLRFNWVTIPRGATITRAYVQFQTDEKTSDATSLTIRGQAADNAATFVNSTANISSRTKTTSAVAWSPVPWTTVGQAGADQQTPSITSVIQEIVNRSGWKSGNSLALIITGTGRRVARAYEGTPAAAPLLRVEYSTGPNTAPTATNVTISGTAQVGQVLTGSYIYSDAEGDVEGTSTYRWLRNGTPIGGATTRTYTPVESDQGTLIRFEVTPVAATGVSLGTPVQSAEVGPVAAPPANTAPTSSNVAITGTPQVGRTVTGSYSYSDAEGDAEGTSTYRWLRDGAPISGATGRSYTLVTADEGAMVAFEVTPVAVTGASPGAPVQSQAVQVLAAPAVSAALSTVTANPTSIAASSGSSTITVTVKDQSGAAMSGVTVVLSATGDGNSLTQPAGATNSSGVATGTLSSTVVGTKTVSATANGTAITQTATVEVTEPPPPPPPGTIAHTLLTSGNHITNQSVFTTASISPAPNALITVAVLGHNSTSAAPSPTLSGGGMSAWTEVATITFDALALPLKRMTVFRAMSASPGSGPITITFSKAQSNAQWIVSQWQGVDISGVNGAGAIVQTGSTRADVVSGLTLTLAPFGNENNVAYGVFGVRSSVPAVTPGAGFTEIAEHASAESPPSALQAQWRSNDNTIDATWVNLRGAVLGVEIKAQ
jgi:uncharacterized protein YjiK